MPEKKIKVGLLFGGKSGEHEISLLSAKSIYEALDKNKYDVVLIGIDKKGQWHLGNSANFLLNADNPEKIKINIDNTTQVTAITKPNETQIISLETGKNLDSIDVFFPIIHGTYGEDGSLQGFLELLNVTYVGANVLGSAIGMDKDVMKRLLQQAQIPIAHFLVLRKNYTAEEINNFIQQVNYPVFVKPANLGSSVGVTKVHNQSELDKAIKDAFQYDVKILIEEAINGREIECSVLGNDNPLVSLPGEIIPKHEFYSYEAKYLDEHGAQLNIPANLDQKTIEKLQHLAIKTFKTLECSGLARVDFFVKDDGEIVVNEINTLPGFTKISMYPKLWGISGITYSDLLDKLIRLAIEKKQQQNQLKRSYA